MKKQIQEQLVKLPKNPGVYKFINAKGDLLYIGKAVNLKSRVSSYFTSPLYDRPRIVPMIDLIEKIETIETNNEVEALVLESALIKQYQPQYNSDAKDDKSFAYLLVTTKDEYPTVKTVRYPSKSDLKRGKIFGPYPSGRAIKHVFSYLRKMYPFCTDDPTKPCFNSYIGLCPGPNASKKEYRENINGIIKFLSGRQKRYIEKLEVQMREYSRNQDFENAANLRDKINDLKYIGQRIDYTYQTNVDDYILKRKEKFKTQVLELASEIGASNLERIECFDISNISGTNAYGSMTVAINGITQTSLYRVFKIKGIDTPNDPAMLLEVLTRRLKHIKTGTDESLSKKPNLILIDGGISQLETVKASIPQDIPVMGISKGKRLKRKGTKQLDEFWIVKGGLIFPITIQNSHILINLRDEAHRFAITHHRKARKFAQKKSVLDEIKGIGPITKRKLMRKYGSVLKIAKARKEDLYGLVKNKKTVENLLTRLNLPMRV